MLLVETASAAVTFQLTHLLRGATYFLPLSARIRWISTHAPLARCDKKYAYEQNGEIDFNSRTSCEVRPSQKFMHWQI